MGNFPALPGYPYGANAPFEHIAANQLSEQGQKSPNATDGSAHAPTGDLEWSGANGGGFLFSTTNPPPFKGKLDLLAGLTCTSSGGAASGALTVDTNVSCTIALFTCSSTATFNTGTTTTFNGTATCTFGSSTTVNLSGATDVRGTMTLKSTANGGPGMLVCEADTEITMSGGGTSALNCIAPAFFTGGVAISSNIVLGSGYTISGGVSSVTARIARKPFATLPNADADLTVAERRYKVPQTVTATRTYTIRHTGTVPTAGEIIKVFRLGPTTPSALYSPQIKREDGTVLFTFYAGLEGSVELEFDGADWQVVDGGLFASGVSGIYDDIW